MYFKQPKTITQGSLSLSKCGGLLAFFRRVSPVAVHMAGVCKKPGSTQISPQIKNTMAL